MKGKVAVLSEKEKEWERGKECEREWESERVRDWESERLRESEIERVRDWEIERVRVAEYSHLRNVNRSFRLLNVEPSSESTISDGCHWGCDVLGVSLGQSVLRGLLEGRDGCWLVDVLLAAGSPVEESRILKDPWIAVTDLECDLVRKDDVVKLNIFLHFRNERVILVLSKCNS